MNFNFENIEQSVRCLLFLHIAAGAIALLILVVPLISRKGGSTHIKAGWIYTYSMILVGVSALVITPWRIFFDPSRELTSKGFSVFLFFISIFTLCSLWHGLISLRFKNRTQASRAALHVGPPIVLIFFGVITQSVGVYQKNILLIIFPLLGHRLAYTQLRYWLEAPKDKMHWWFAHMNGMFSACIATITAFLVTALPRLWPNDFTNSPALWIAPGLVLGVILSKWTASYKLKFSKS